MRWVVATCLLAACSSTDSEPRGYTNACVEGGLGMWTGKDNVAPSQDPPCGLKPSQVPMFVSLGWDDNGDAEGMAWARKVVEDRGGKATFYVTSSYGSAADVQAAWRAAHEAGNEIGNHTVLHEEGKAFTAQQWSDEITGCTEFLTKTSSPPVMSKVELFGFRTPYLSYNDAMLATVDKNGFWYDCSIEEGYEDGHDGTNYYWPYTLDGKSPGHTVQVEWGGADAPKEIAARPGLWEMPVYALVVPPDDKCAQYNVPKGLRAKLHAVQDWFDPEDGKITGFDFNLWALRGDGGFEMTKAEFTATLEYSFDLHYNGNRAPFLLGVHSPYYVDEWNVNAPNAKVSADRRAAVEAFLDYVKAKPGVRIAPVKAVLDWMRAPQAL